MLYLISWELRRLQRQKQCSLQASQNYGNVSALRVPIALRIMLHLQLTYTMQADGVCCHLQALLRPGLRCCATSWIAIAPFLLFQVYGWWSFCLPRDNPGRPGWCSNTVPYLYGYVQRKHWNVGLLRFYTWRQVGPNGTLACGALHGPS